MLGYYNPSVILTYLSLISATLGIVYSAHPDSKGIFGAIFCLMLSGILDLFDGAVAAKCKRSEEEKLFGIQIDSLCDLVAFGALPACITLRLASLSRFSRVAAGLILLSSVIRLAYFNVQETMRDRSEKRTFYTGLPVTALSILFPLTLLIAGLFDLPIRIFAPASLCLFAALEVSPLPLRKPYRWGKAILVILGVILFIAMLLAKKRIGF